MPEPAEITGRAQSKTGEVGKAAQHGRYHGQLHEGSNLSVALSSGRTILFTSHDMEAVSRICGAAIVLDRGRVVFHGTANGAIDRYRAIMQIPGPLAPAAPAA